MAVSAENENQRFISTLLFSFSSGLFFFGPSPGEATGPRIHLHLFSGCAILYGVSAEVPVTQLLRESRRGDQEATNRLIPVVYGHLHALASQYMRNERQDHTLSATALLNEAYLKLAGTDIEWQDRSHFFVIASRVMRQILVDHAKAHNRLKRGAGGRKVALEEVDIAAAGSSAGMVELDEALTRLARQDERKARLMELLYFGGLTYQEAAQALDISEVTVHRDVKIAKAWLRKALAG
jgi:RNA polymerase sigma factor (TIGR02999 family)